MDAKIKEMIDNRQKANIEILQILGEAVMKYPDLRFGQILVNLSVLKYEHDYINDVSIIHDPFHEESVVTLNRMKK